MTVTVKRANNMKVKDVRRQISEDRRWEEERRHVKTIETM